MLLEFPRQREKDLNCDGAVGEEHFRDLYTATAWRGVTKRGKTETEELQSEEGTSEDDRAFRGAGRSEERRDFVWMG